MDAFNSEIGSQVAEEVQNSPAAFLLTLRAHYLNMGDPTEYKFARKHIGGGWEGWCRLLENKETATVIGQWRDELAAKLRSEALQRIMEAAEGTTRDSLGANKYIYEAMTPKSNGVGRPSNEKIQQKAQEFFEDERRKEEAYQRILGNNAKEQEKEQI